MKLLSWIAALIGALVIVVSVDHCIARDSLRLGTWNIENLGARHPTSSDPKDFPQKPSDLATNILDSGVQVLALQEIHDIGPGSRRNEVLDKTFEIVNDEDGNDWEYMLLPKKDPSDTHQMLGIAWNTSKVELVKPNDDGFISHPVPESVSGFNVFDRGLHAVKFRVNGDNKTDFVLIPVHLKSNVGGNWTKTQRGIEVEILLDQFLSTVQSTLHDEDIIVLGDTNCTSDGEQAIVNFAAAGFEDLNDDQGTYVTGAQFDRFFVPSQPELTGLAMNVFKPLAGGDDGPHEEKLSDHFLSWIDIRVQNDDDGEIAGGGSDMEAPAAASVSILAVLPDPVGLDSQNERVTLANTSSVSVSLDGWKLLDADGHEMPLSGSIEGNDVKAIHRAEDFSLNQSGDTVFLIDTNGAVVDQQSYQADDVHRGKFIVNRQ